MNEQQTQSRMQQLAGEAAALFDRADAEGRPLTRGERADAQEKMARFKDLRARAQAFNVAGRIGSPDSEDWVYGGDAWPAPAALPRPAPCVRVGCDHEARPARGADLHGPPALLDHPALPAPPPPPGRCRQAGRGLRGGYQSGYQSGRN
jgi:hypothetical protein